MNYLLLISVVLISLLGLALTCAETTIVSAGSSTGSMSVARGDSTATLLPSGKVLMTGGRNQNLQRLFSSELYDPNTGTWGTTGSVATARFGHSATLLPSGKVLVIGGSNGTYLSSCELYDPRAGTWSSTGSLSNVRYAHTATMLPSGKVLVTGGYGSSRILSSCELYDPRTGTWSSTGAMVAARNHHTAVLLPAGKILVMGGYGTSGVLAACEVFNPDTGTWSATGSLATARERHSATLLFSGKVLVTGGLSRGTLGGSLVGSIVLSSCERYDPIAGTWGATAPLPAARQGYTTTLLPSGHVLVTGGHGNNASIPLPGALYHPQTNTWQASGFLTTERSGSTATLLPSGQVLLMGGIGNSGYLSSCELYEPRPSARWGSTAALSAPRTFHTATTLLSGKVLVAGGSMDNPDGTTSFLTRCELYDPSNASWSSTGALATGRFWHTAILLPSGKVLAVGGNYHNPPLASCELYDPQTGTWSATGSLAIGRYHPTLTLLPSGKVLVTGYQASCELYDPGLGTWSPTGSLPADQEFHTATLLPSGKVLLAGGRGGSATTNYLNSCFLYDPQVGTWSTTGAMATGRYFHTATLLPSGKVLVAGGAWELADGFGMKFCELYDPATGRWGAAAAMATYRSEHTATLLPCGEVLVTGAPNYFDGQGFCEIYNPNTGKWRETARSSGTVYTGYTASLLASGTVLVSGGRDYNDQSILAFCELFDAGLAFSASDQPAITVMPSTLALGSQLSLAGRLFTGRSEASSGGVASSPTNYPLVQIQSRVNEQQQWLAYDSASSYSATTVTTTLVTGLPIGPAWVRVFANGIASPARSITIVTGTLPSVPVITTNTLPVGAVGAAYRQTLAATNSPTTWKITSGILPAGLFLTASTGTIAGRPTASGTRTFILTASNAKGTSVAKTLSLSINAPVSGGSWIAIGDQGQTPVSLRGVQAIAAGWGFTVALKGDGAVVAWGDNIDGHTIVPDHLTGVTAIATGYFHTVALKSNGTVEVWGDNLSGQMQIPVGLSGVTAIAAGGNHTVALKGDGTVVAWGDNGDFQTEPPAGLAGVTAIAAGGAHTVALKRDGTVVAWGDNSAGQTSIPAGLAGVTAIAAGGAHTVALKRDGTVVAWGDNSAGQASIPAGLNGVTAIVAGNACTMALKGDGTVVAWGDNGEGQTSVPADLSGVTAIAGGLNHTVALKRDGAVVAWGNNSSGQTNIPADLTGVTAIAASDVYTVALKGDRTVVAWGNNRSGQTNIPSGLSGVLAIAAGGTHTVALKGDGSVVAWGNNLYGQTHIPAALAGVIAIAAGNVHTVALKADGTVEAWGNNGHGQISIPAGVSGVTAVAAGYYHTVALKTDGTVVGWGSNYATPAGLTGVTAIAAGGFHTVALKADGTVVAWGDNTFGQTVIPAGLTGVTAIAAGRSHTVALKSNGTVVAWGDSRLNQTSIPLGLNVVMGIAAGWNQTWLRVTARPANAVTITSATVVYDGTAKHVAIASANGRRTPTTISYNGAYFQPTAAGTYTVVAEANYLDSYGAATGTLTITKAALSVITAGASRAYGSANPLFTGTVKGVATGDGIIATYASSASANTAVGIYGPTTPEAITPTLVDPGHRLGNYTVTTTKGTLNITGSGTGRISREVWTGIPGIALAAIPLTISPNLRDELTSFETPTNWADNYGTRIRGSLCPTVSGAYTFWIASDDNSELWLGTDANANSRRKIASISGWTVPRDWSKFPSQQSQTITLTAGQRYYIEALQKDGTGGDNLAVAWQGPGIARQVIPGSVMAVFTVPVDGFVRDLFASAVIGADLLGRTADVGGVWMRNASSAQTGQLVVTTAHRVRSNAIAGSTYYLPTSTQMGDYVVSATITPLSLLAGNRAGVVGRVAATGFEYDSARYDAGSRQWQIYRVHGGGVLLGSYPQTLTIGQPYVLKLSRRGAQMILTVDGVARITVTDSVTATPVAPSFVGLRSEGLTTDTSGLHMSNFVGQNPASATPHITEIAEPELVTSNG